MFCIIQMFSSDLILCWRLEIRSLNELLVFLDHRSYSRVTDHSHSHIGCIIYVAVALLIILIVSNTSSVTAESRVQQVYSYRHAYRKVWLL